MPPCLKRDVCSEITWQLRGKKKELDLWLGTRERKVANLENYHEMF